MTRHPRRSRCRRGAGARSGALLRVLLGLALAGAAAADEAAAGGDQGVLMQAMRDELARSVDALQMDRMERPYFVSYRVDEVESTSSVATFGALVSSTSNRDRVLSVEVRVGSLALDNTNFMPSRIGSSPALRTLTLPLDDDYRELRRQLWLHTDAAYKHALETLARKRAALANRTREDLSDFSAADSHEHFGEAADHRRGPRPGDGEALADLARALSAVFKEFPAIHASRANASRRVTRSYYVNSEGTAFTQARAKVHVEVLAKTQAEDGTVLQDFESLHGRDVAELGEPQALAERIEAMAASLTRRRGAAPIGRYSGPVLFEGQAAAELFAQIIMPRLTAVRVPVAEDARMEGFTTTLRNPFEDKIGARVLPRALRVVDDPTLDIHNGAPLYGGYAMDDDGVRAAPTTLIENGILKTLLATRNPIAGIAKSTGNRRMMGIAMPSNLIVAPDPNRAFADDELVEEFRMLLRERGNDYGVVVRRIANPVAKLDRSDNTRTPSGGVVVDRLTHAFRVYPDGREEPIRLAELSGIGESDFRSIVAVSADTINYTFRSVPTTAYSLVATSAQYGDTSPQGWVSIAAPDLLFEELTLRDPVGNLPLPPVATHPHFD